VNESDHKRRLVADIRKLPGAWAQRIEDRYAPGTLDLIIKLPALPIVFAEGKIIVGNLFGPTLRQWEKGLEMQEAGLRVLLLGWKSGIMYISPWVQQADWRKCEVEGVVYKNHVAGLREYLTFNKENPE
jgi:hypothetical protein